MNSHEISIELLDSILFIPPFFSLSFSLSFFPTFFCCFSTRSNRIVHSHAFIAIEWLCNRFDRLKSKRIYKTLLRSHHKHSSSESQRTESTSNSVIDVTDHPESATRQTVAVIHLKRSSSTPNLKRIWLCQSCNVLQQSVTWHCLNCECVSIVAPIYKDTTQKGCIRNANVGNANVKCKTKPSNHSVSSTTAIACSKSIATANAMNPTFIDYDRIHRSHRMDLCPVLIAAQTNSTTGDCYLNQIKSNTVIRFQPVAGLCPLNRHAENKTKSVPNIVNAFHDHETQRKFSSVDDDDDQSTTIWSEHFFGERIFTVNKPQPFHHTIGSAATATPISSSSYASIRNSARNKAITPMHEIQKFTRYATKSAVRESSAVKKMCTPGEACRMCNMGRCNGSLGDSNSTNSFSIVHNSTKTHMPTMENALLDTSRFTVTTLSRSNNALIKSKDKNQTSLSSRNVGGGVLIAVRDWSAQEKIGGSNAVKNGITMGNTVTPLSPPPAASSAAAAAAAASDSYYEILRNPNNNTAGATAILASESNKELLNNRMAKTQAHIYENSAMSGKSVESNGPIYAVVNKMNKTKNIKALGGSEKAVVAVENLKSPDQTRFTYIGMSKPMKSTTTTPTTIPTPTTAMSTDAIFASGKQTSNNNNISSSNNSSSSNNNNGALTNNVMMSLNNVNNNNTNNNNNNNNGVSSSSSSSSNDCTPILTTNAEYSTKVWKGQKKPLEANKM